MPSKVTLFHKVDGAVEIDSCLVDETLIHKDEWAAEPWDKPAAEAPTRGRRGQQAESTDPADA